MSELRLLSYNVRSLRDDASAVAAVIRACRPDVVCVQEAPRFLRWRSKRAALARASGMVVGTAYRPGGLMVMTSLSARVLDTTATLLPKTPKLHQRAVTAARVSLHGERWTVASIHLSLDADERLAHLEPLWAALPDSTDAPLVVAGDVNELPDGAVWQQLATRLQDAWAVGGAGSGYTYSAANPHKRIDGVFVDHRVEVVECRPVDDVDEVGRASDHLPVLAVLRQSRR
jgi:endonuclease/exonuclease/phosphatase family metal-dependent hydrolase